MDQQLVNEIELLYERVCKALGDPKRVMILYALAERPMYVSELAEELHIPQPTISRHLKILSDRCLVMAARNGTAVYYTVKDERVLQALDLLRAVLRDRILEHARVFGE